MAMKRTLLELTSSILASLDGDEVSTITDTAEAVQVADIIRQCFYEIASTRSLPEHHSLFNLDETDGSTPVVMTRPSSVITVDWVKYDVGDSTEDLTTIIYLPLKDFLERQNSLNENETGVDLFDFTFDTDPISLKYRNDKAPEFYTTIGDLYVLFDSFDSSSESFLAADKTQCYGLLEATWTHTGSFVPPLDHKLSNLLFQKAKAQAFVELKQMDNPQTERKVRTAEIKMVKDKYDMNNKDSEYYYTNFPNYGRK